MQPDSNVIKEGLVIHDSFKRVAVALRFTPRSPGSNQLLTTSQKCGYAKLAKFRPLVQKIRSGSTFDNSTLKIRPRSPKSTQLFSHSQE